jgi:hypothetical protein
MSGGRMRIIGAAGLAAGAAALSYPLLFRRWCLTWGARPGEVTRELPGDELLVKADIVSTRAITVEAPADAIWPWLVQMGSAAPGLPSGTKARPGGHYPGVPDRPERYGNARERTAAYC